MQYKTMKYKQNISYFNYKTNFKMNNEKPF